jgi:hypothetical protein
VRIDAGILQYAARLLVGLSIGAPFVLHRWRELQGLTAARLTLGQAIARGVRSSVGLTRRRRRLLSDKRRRTLLAVQSPAGAGDLS